MSSVNIIIPISHLAKFQAQGYEITQLWQSQEWNPGAANALSFVLALGLYTPWQMSFLSMDYIVEIEICHANQSAEFWPEVSKVSNHFSFLNFGVHNSRHLKGAWFSVYGCSTFSENQTPLWCLKFAIQKLRHPKSLVTFETHCP